MPHSLLAAGVFVVDRLALLSVGETSHDSAVKGQDNG